MLGKKKPHDLNLMFNVAIGDTLGRMIDSQNSDERTALAEQLENVAKAKENLTQGKYDKADVLKIAGTLLGLGMIMMFERRDIITTKALGFVGR